MSKTPRPDEYEQALRSEMSQYVRLLTDRAEKAEAERDALRKLLVEAVTRLEHLRQPLCERLKHSEYDCTCGHIDLVVRVTATLEEKK